MFRDRERFNARFVQADIMATDGALAEFKGKLDIIYIAQVRWTSQASGQTEPDHDLADLTKHTLCIGPPPMELGRPNRSMQKTYQSLQARLSDSR